MLRSTFLAVLVFTIFCVNAAARKSDQDFTSACRDIVAKYDLMHPPLAQGVVRKPHHHAKRCVLQGGPHEAVAAYNKNTYKTPSSDKFGSFFVDSPCMGADSLGNVLGVYFEGVMCAHFSGMHYIAAAKIWESELSDLTSPFLAYLPTFIQHEKPIKDREVVKGLLQQHCRCHGSCHERPESAFIHGLPIIKDMLKEALEYHINKTDGTLFKQTLIVESDKATVPVGTVLPFIPDAAIHYRCGDNFIGHYGFLPFEAFLSRIPQSVKTIFVLAEKRSRKTATKPHLAMKCDSILNSLFSYLAKSYPSASVLLRRGDDLYADFARLSFASVTVCSVSTFCLWPAILNNGTAYFPKTRLIMSGDTSVDLGFRWFDSPAVVYGSFWVDQPTAELLKRLHEKSPHYALAASAAPASPAISNVLMANVANAGAASGSWVGGWAGSSSTSASTSSLRKGPNSKTMSAANGAPAGGFESFMGGHGGQHGGLDRLSRPGLGQESGRGFAPLPRIDEAPIPPTKTAKGSHRVRAKTKFHQQIQQQQQQQQFQAIAQPNRVY